MSKPRLLDLFCGEGGAAAGYAAAGFDVDGVDLRPEVKKKWPRHLPGIKDCRTMDALEYLDRWGHCYDAIHASPPCQAYSRLKSIHRFNTRQHPELIEPTRQGLARIGKPHVIENVPGSDLGTHVVLCGSMFGLGATCDGVFHQLRRHREFWCSWFFLMPLACKHVGRPVGVYGNGGSHRRIKDRPGINGFTGTASERRCAMGIDWMSRYGLSQAIPPAYTEFIGRQLLAQLEGVTP